MFDAIYGVPYSGCEFTSDIPCVSEEEAVALAAGAKLVGKKNVQVFMQNSGLGRCLDIITSLLKPYRIDVPLFIFHRNNPEHHYYMGKIQNQLMELLGYE